MNEILRSLHDRKSVRVYEDRPIEDDVKQAILAAAVQAPTAVISHPNCKFTLRQALQFTLSPTSWLI